MPPRRKTARVGRRSGALANARDVVPPPEPPSARTEDWQLPEAPGPITMTILVAFVIIGGHLAAPYIANPASVPRPWLYVVAGLLATVSFLAVATLTELAYCIRFLRSLPSSKRFFSFVGNYSAVGAVAGTVLGLRMAGPLLIDSQRHPSASGFNFGDLLGVVGNTITMLTLFMVALCWPYAWGPVREIAKEERSKLGDSRKRSRRSASALAFPVLMAGNLGGLYAASAVWRILVP